MSPKSGASHPSVRSLVRPSYASARVENTLARTLDRFGPAFDAAYQPEGIDLHHLDQPGPALVVGNHSGGTLAMFEPLLLAHVARRSVPLARLPHLLLHEILWHTPLAPTLLELGAVRASGENADAILQGGRNALVYPGGDREPFRSFADRDTLRFGDRRGYIKLALKHGVPIVPVVTAGMHSGFVCFSDGHAFAQRFPLARAFRVGVLPVTLSFPFGLTFGAPPPYLPMSGRVKIRALPPIRFTRRGTEAANDEAYVEACHRVLTHAMQTALHALADTRRTERRAALHASLTQRFDRLWAHRLLDRALDAVERWTLAPRPVSLPAPERLSSPDQLRPSWAA